MDATVEGLEFEDRDGYLEARFLGAFAVARFNRQSEAASQACRERKLKKLLVDLLRLQGNLSTLERYEIASYAVRVSAGLMVALLVVPAFLDPNKFGIMVAQNRGLIVDAFTERQKAIDWLQTDGTSRNRLP